MKTNLLVGALCLFILAAPALAQDKAADSPAFWQRDSLAHFPNDGRDFCAPTSVSDGLIYLANERGFDDLVGTTDHNGQIELIKELAKEMGTDPKAGTGPDQIINGVKSYVEKAGFKFKRIEIATWRPLQRENLRYRVGEKPQWAWMQSSASHPDTIVLLNVGWYAHRAEGWVRSGGHWMDVVGADSATTQLLVNNPLTPEEQQKKQQKLNLQRLPDDEAFFRQEGDSGEALRGFYRADGPALARYSGIVAVVDAVIVFELEPPAAP